jgi:hypothetical protein
MKFRRLIISTSFLIVLGLCITNFTYAQTLRSVKPLFTEEEALILLKAEGYWKLSENEQMIIEKSGDNFYRIEFIDANYSSIHEGVFTKLGSEYYLHISPFYKDGTILSQINSLPLYVIFQIEINDSVFLLHDFSEGFIKNKLLPSSYTIDDNGMVVFSEFEKLKKILTKSINDKTIFSATTTLERVRNVAVQSDTLPIYVYGPNFLSDEIKYRFSKQITGPWSKSRVLYNTPEQTINNPSYDKRHMCYLARTHSEFFNSSQRKFLITYDCNSTDFFHASTNDFIYIPRVLSIKIPKEIK